MICFAISSSFSRVSVFDFVNKACIAAVCLCIIVLFCIKQQPYCSILILVAAGFVHVIAFAYPISSQEGIATYFTYAFWILFWLYIGNNTTDLLIACKELAFGLRISLFVWTLITAVSLLIPSCYKVGWGGERYFVSFTNDSFEIAPIATFMLTLTILLYKFDQNKRRAFNYSLIPLACVFAAGTRTYLIVVLAEFILLLRLLIDKRGYFLIALGISIALFIMIAAATNIGQKFASAIIDSNDISVFLEVFTNGRSEFWEIDLNAFFDGNAFEIAFGHGFSFVYDLNQHAMGVRLYAHNDFINILLNFGIAGLVVYFAVFLPVMRKVVCIQGFTASSLLIAIWLFNAFFNMIYVYIAAVMALGILVAALSAEPAREAVLGRGCCEVVAPSLGMTS